MYGVFTKLMYGGCTMYVWSQHVPGVYKSMVAGCGTTYLQYN